jgi:hypothetical protein
MKPTRPTIVPTRALFASPATICAAKSWSGGTWLMSQSMKRARASGVSTTRTAMLTISSRPGMTAKSAPYARPAAVRPPPARL